MFSSLSFKQKLIVGGILVLMLFVIGYYGYTQLKPEEEIETFSSENFLLEESVPLQNQEISQPTEVVQQTMMVHVTGQVKKSGIVELPVGSRIIDAICLAGGKTEKADLDKVNLAYPLKDGQKIYIPSVDEKEEKKEYITSGSGNNVIIEDRNIEGAMQKVNINHASQTELQELPGIGPSLAAQILVYRNENGSFKQVEDLQNVKGIGDAKFQKIKDLVTVK